jgi:hypothetical protein
VNEDPTTGDALKTTWEPSAKVPESLAQPTPQLIPVGADVTGPLFFPTLVEGHRAAPFRSGPWPWAVVAQIGVVVVPLGADGWRC